MPEELRPYVGTYHFAAMQADFTVSYQDGDLAIYDPLEKRTVKLRPPDETGWRTDEFDKNKLLFETDDEGNVTQLKIDSISTLRRK